MQRPDTTTATPAVPSTSSSRKLDDESILITTCDRGQAVIRRRRSEQGRWEYRYIPVTEVSVTGDGGVMCRELEKP